MKTWPGHLRQAVRSPTRSYDEFRKFARSPFPFPPWIEGKKKNVYINIKNWWSYLIYSSLWNCASGSEIPSRSHVVTRGQRLLSIRAPLGGGTWWISERCSFHLLTGEIAWGRRRVPDKRDPPPCLTLINIQLCPLNPSRWAATRRPIYSSPYFFILNHGGWCGRCCRVAVIMM